jgi:hypothetical protein
MKGSIFWDIMPCRPLKSTDVSEEHVSILRLKENAKQETNTKQFASTANFFMPMVQIFAAGKTSGL